MIEFCMEGDSLKPNPKTCCHPRLQDRPSSFAFCSRIYAFHPGHHLVCHRHSLASQELGLASAFLRQGHSSHLAIISLLDEKTAVEDNRVLLKIQFRFFIHAIHISAQASALFLLLLPYLGQAVYPFP